MKEETKILYFPVDIFPKEIEDDEGKPVEVYDLQTHEFTITPWVKKKMLEGMGFAFSQNYKAPFTILVPLSFISERPKDFVDPLPFLEHTFYIVPYLRKVLVYEQRRE
jgi:hypothetical protein